MNERGKRLDETYKLAWVRGLKTTYYLRTLAATSAEKSTGRGGELNAVSSGAGVAAGSAGLGKSAAPIGTKTAVVDEIAPKFCAIDDPTCEACQCRRTPIVRGYRPGEHVRVRGVEG